MAWWGRAIGGTVGVLIGGPIGAILGYVAGGFFDRGLKKNMGGEFTANERRQTLFYAGLFSVLGHIAKVDGYVSRDEIKFAEHIMEQMSLNAAQRKVAINLFRAGKADDFEVAPVLKQFAKECGNRRSVKKVFLEVLISGALCDGALDEIERSELAAIAGELGFSRATFQEILESLYSHTDYSTGRKAASLDEDYKLLGVEQNANYAEVKRAYRRKMSQYHPDKLVSKGLPDEMIQIATERTKQFRAAYERIKENIKTRKTVY